jgi:hypothetical protein
VGRQTVNNLAAGTQTILNFQWNTAGWTISAMCGNYTVRAFAWPVTNETELEDNSYVNGKVILKLLGDIGGGVPPAFFQFDGKCDGKDLSLFLMCFKGTAPPEAKWLGDLGGGIPPTFFNYDYKVDGKDLSLFLLCYKGQGP